MSISGEKRSVTQPQRTTFTALGALSTVPGVSIPRTTTQNPSTSKALSVASKADSEKQKNLEEIKYKRAVLDLEKEYKMNKLQLEREIRGYGKEEDLNDEDKKKTKSLKQELEDLEYAFKLNQEYLNENFKLNQEEIDARADENEQDLKEEDPGDFFSIGSRHEADEHEDKHEQQEEEEERNQPKDPLEVIANAIAKLGSGRPQDLPFFNGKAETWPMFFNEYIRTTKKHKISNSENLIRIRKALKDSAKEAVSGLLDEPRCVPEIIEILRNRFGRPEFILEELIQKAKEVKSPDVNKPETIIAFGTVVQNLVARIKSMNKKQYLYDITLLRELVRKLPTLHATEWLRWVSYDYSREENLDYFAQWMSSMVSFAERLHKPKISGSYKDDSSEEKKSRGNKGYGVHAAVRESSSSSCLYCDKENHLIDKCYEFKKIRFNEKKEFLKKKGACFLCLRTGHRASECKKPVKCSVKNCPKPDTHHPAIHFDTQKKSEAKDEDDEDKDLVEAPVVDKSMNMISAKCNILPIIPVILKGPKGRKKVYALLDTAASFCMMEESVAKELGIDGPKETLKYSVFKDTRKDHSSKKVSIQVRGDYDRAPYYQVNCVHTVKAMDLPARTFNAESMKKSHPHLKNMKTRSMKDARPQLLLGINAGGLFAARKILEPAPGEAPAAIRSLLGWYIIENEETAGRHLQYMSLDEKMHEDVKNFIAVENLGIPERPSNRSIEDDKALKIFQNSATCVNNRWTIALPWKDEDAQLPSSKEMAMNRLRTMEKKMAKNPVFMELCQQKFQEYIDQGYLRKVNPEENLSNKKWYLPWFMVYHPSKKPRLVFDGAAQVHGRSLNDYLLTGPDLLRPLTSVLIRFRRHAIALTSDIKSMFHQVNLKEKDWPSQTIIFRTSQDQQPEEFVMTCLFFGAASSPSAACFVKDENAKRFQDKHPKAVHAILHDFYVDDFLSGAESEEEAIKLQREVTMIHSKGGFPLTKWKSTSKGVMKHIPEELRATKEENAAKIVSDTDWEKTLGMLWSSNQDEFSFKLSEEKIPQDILSGEKIPTKRMVTSVVMSIFDPLGFIAILKLQGLLIIQRIWRTGIGWDDFIDDSTFSVWKAWLLQIQSVKNIRIPRRLCPISINEVQEVDLHVFCDASDSAYACAAYLRLNTGGSVFTPFVMGKVRIGPMRGITIPRMELNAAVIGVQVAKVIQEAFQEDLKIRKTVFWTDSSTVLHWIRATDKRFKQYVGNRIDQILSLSEAANWKWVPTAENVADDATKKKDMELTSESRWYNGPPFLKLEPDEWPQEPNKANEDSDSEMLHVAIKEPKKDELYLPDPEKFSCWYRLIQATAFRFPAARRIAKKEPRHTTMEDMRQAEDLMIKRHQDKFFEEEKQILLRGGVVEKKSRLFMLSPRLNDKGIIVLGGRLDNANLPERTKYPPILDPKDPYVKLFIGWYHKTGQHYGQERIINEIRKVAWILHIRAAVKRCKTDCLVCKIKNVKPIIPEMGQLPKGRVTGDTMPFHHTGVDYFGPLQVKVLRSKVKRWGVIFTCLATRAVHLEVADSLSTSDMINCLIRFINLRGNPAHLWSDNGTNFVGADREIKESLEDWNQSQIRKELLKKGIIWHFIPPGSPHMGGVWERVIRDVKRILQTLLKEAYPSDGVLRTVFAEVTGILNSRPLTTASPDPDDPRCLTPNDLLRIACVTGPTIPGDYVDHDKIRRGWRISERLAQEFWTRWSKEYLPWLAQRQKWNQQTRPLQVGDIVLVLEENAPRNEWKKGLVTATYPCKKGIVRFVDVRVARIDMDDKERKVKISYLRRPVAKLCPIL